MNKIIYLIVALTIISCNNSKEIKDKSTNNNKKNEFFTDFLLSFDEEKIVLLSISKDIPYKKTKSVLRDYLKKTKDSLFKESGFYFSVIDTVAKKNNLTQKEVANIIYNYNYNIGN